MSPLSEALARHREQGIYRKLSVTPENALDYASNDYLGLAHYPKVREQLIQALREGCPLGGRGSRLLSGQTPWHEQVESDLAQIYGAPSALLFSSGYLANLAAATTFGSLDAHFFSDELIHASWIDGLHLARSPKSIFRHNDMDHLQALLEASSAPQKVILTESVFSMDGDLAPLNELSELARQHNAWLVVDEAHATGIYGECGLGRSEGRHAKFNKWISVHTGGKALGAQGAFVICHHEFRELMIQRARSFIFTTALAPLQALHLQFALKAVLEEPSRGKDLLQRAERFQMSLPKNGSAVSSESPIVPVILGSNEKALHVAQALQERGFDVRAIRSPTVPQGTERLRLTLKSYHSVESDQRLIEELKELI